MRLAVIAVGRLKAGPERELCERYAQRSRDSGRALGFTGPEIIEINESRARRPEERRADEAAAIIARCPPGIVLVLDERGACLDSAGFCQRIARARDAGAAAISLIIGGADGLDAAVREKADLIASFGAMTLPHQLVRILALEQLYRAMTMLAGHPYHRA